VPFKIPGFGGTFYEPGERKGNVYILWRGRDDHGAKLEIITDSRHPEAAKTYVRDHLRIRASRRPPTAGAQDVTLATVDTHYRAERGLDEFHPDWKRLEFLRGRDGTRSVGRINNAIVKATAEAWLDQRRRDVAAALAMTDAERRAAKINKGSLKAPTWSTANREVVTPYRALLKYAAQQEWRSEIVVHGLRAPEGSLPPAPPRIAEDETVLKLLETIEERIAAKPTPWTMEKLLTRRAFVWLVHERGYRVSEWMRFDWEWIELPKARARMAITKRKDELRWEDFELSETAVAFLAALGPRDAGRIFPWHSRSNIYKWSDRLIGPALKWRPHESRRAIVSHIVASTGDYKQAGRYVGHASEKTTFRYRILGSADLAPEVRFMKQIKA
jgi:site-specific recombinase XerD